MYGEPAMAESGVDYAEQWRNRNLLQNRSANRQCNSPASWTLGIWTLFIVFGLLVRS